MSASAVVIVTILVNGAIVPSFAPARLRAGHVMGPIAPIVAAIASKIVYVPQTRTILVERSSRRISVPVAFVADGVPYVALAPVVRALGGDAAYDPRAQTLAIAIDGARDVQTPAPFDPSAPQVAPTTIFTPEPPPPTPRAVDTGVPRPRRTAIPVVPSQPQPALSAPP